MARLPKHIIKKYGITKKAWRIFKGRKRKTNKPRQTKKTRRRRKSTGGNKRVTRRGFLNTQSIFKWLRIGALLAPAAARALGPGSADVKVKRILLDYTGYNMDTRRWRWDVMISAWTPFLVTSLMTYGIPKLTGIIRRL